MIPVVAGHEGSQPSSLVAAGAVRGKPASTSVAFSSGGAVYQPPWVFSVPKNV
jgi:hypothetical protein